MNNINNRVWISADRKHGPGCWATIINCIRLVSRNDVIFNSNAFCFPQMIVILETLMKYKYICISCFSYILTWIKMLLPKHSLSQAVRWFQTIRFCLNKNRTQQVIVSLANVPLLDFLVFLLDNKLTWEGHIDSLRRISRLRRNIDIMRLWLFHYHPSHLTDATDVTLGANSHPLGTLRKQAAP